MEKCILKDQNSILKWQAQQHYLSVEKMWVFFPAMDEALQKIVHQFAF